MSTIEAPERILTREPAQGDTPNIFPTVYQENTNIIIWQRKLNSSVVSAVNHFLEAAPKKAALLAVTPSNTHEVLYDTYGKSEAMATLADDIALLVDMFCCLFDLPEAGLRLTILDRAMCPRFHVDHIPCRLVTTYKGIATEWLSHNDIDRSKLGAGNQGKSDEESGLFKNVNDINRLTEGDVALLKGENWDEIKGTGLVHRSPAVQPGEIRLLLTLDFISD